MHKLIALLLIVAGLAFGIAHQVHASDICPPLDSGKIDTIGDPATVTVTAPADQLIDGYCVKAGTTTEFVVVNPPAESVVIDHSVKDSVSHYSVSYVDAPDETTTTSTTTTTTTEAPPVTTAPVTTQPATTQPPTTADRGTQVPGEQYPDPCIIDGVRVPEGDYMLVKYPDNEGTTEFGFFPCSRIPNTSPTTAPAVTTPEAAPTLPATGNEWTIAAIAAAFMLAGAGAVTVARRS